MLTKKQLRIIAIAALVVSFSLLDGAIVAAATPTTVTITSSATHPAVNQRFTLSGTLKSGTTPFSGKTIIIRRVDWANKWSAAGTTTTNSKGAYALPRSESTSGPYIYHAAFNGDTTHAPTDAPVSIPIGNLQESAISIFTTNYAPAVKHSYTLYGFLQTGVSGRPLAGRSIGLGIRYPSGQFVHMTTTTATNGAYSFTRSESAQGTYYCYVSFTGTSSYHASSSMLTVTVGNPMQTLLSLKITDSTPNVNQPFTISGYLTDIHGAKLPGRRITMDTRLSTGQWASRGQTTTDSNGHYSVTLSEKTSGQYRYEAHFLGDGTHASVTSGVEVAIGALQPTKISMKSTLSNPHVGESFTLSGILTDANSKPLSGKEIDLYRYVVGAPTQRGNIFQTRYTDSNGHYFFVLHESTSGKYVYTAWFYGDQTHALSHNSVSLTIGTLTSTTTTITASNKYPAVGQTVTLTVNLKAGTIGLSKPVKIWHTTNGVRYEDGTHNTVNGVYKFTQAFGSKGQRVYHAEFAATGSYRASAGTVTVNVQ